MNKARLQELRGRLRLAWSILRGRDGNAVRHAQRETAKMASAPKDDPDSWMAENLVDLVRVFSAQGHSGFSASWCTSSLEKLLRFRPLGPLTGEEDEWAALDYHDDMEAQNKRCSSVFRRKDGSAYNSTAVVFREPDGTDYQSKFSCADITFPYTPKTVYADVPFNASDEVKAEAARRALETSHA